MGNLISYYITKGNKEAAGHVNICGQKVYPVGLVVSPENISKVMYYIAYSLFYLVSTSLSESTLQAFKIFWVDNRVGKNCTSFR